MNFDEPLREAVRAFWAARARQANSQGAATGIKDTGNRAAVTGGRHVDGFVRLIGAVLTQAGLARDAIHVVKRQRVLPDYFRASKDWDVVVRVGNDLVAVIELKSQVGSFGNNFNNRVEEAVGNATDFWTAYREGAFAPSVRPWLGYLMVLEEHPRSLAPCRPVVLPHYPMRAEFQGASYAQRYAVLCERLVRERLYDAACLLLSPAADAMTGAYREPHVELTFRAFALSLVARARAFVTLAG